MIGSQTSLSICGSASSSSTADWTRSSRYAAVQPHVSVAVSPLKKSADQTRPRPTRPKLHGQTRYHFLVRHRHRGTGTGTGAEWPLCFLDRPFWRSKGDGLSLGSALVGVTSGFVRCGTTGVCERAPILSPRPTHHLALSHQKVVARLAHAPSGRHTAVAFLSKPH